VKILFIEWESYGWQDMKEAFTEEGHDLVCFPFQVFGHQGEELLRDPETERRLRSVLRKEVPDLVFSIDYFPVISSVCQREDVRYVSFNYDCPHILLSSNTIVNPCNKIFVFDKATYLEYHHAGISTFHYMPLAANTKRLDAIDPYLSGVTLPTCDVSFVGSLYLEKGNYFDQIEPALPERARGYLKALITVQLKILGYDLVHEMLPAILDDLYQVCPVDPMRDSVQPVSFFYEHHVINRRITAIERIDLLETLAQEHSVDLFTHIKDFPLPGLNVHGGVDYFHEMPLVFKRSKINLNITLRSIRSGIPLRVFDIMGAGGFLLSNYQADFQDLFVPDEDFVYYESKEDLLRKVGYYLNHEDERKAIARNGHEKIAAKHTYRHRVKEMLAF